MGNMKANRKFKEEDNAVSAVIGVILMVAITVAIAATVYVYVSGMLGGGPSQSATVSLVQTSNYISIQKVTAGGPINCSDTSIDITCVDSVGVNQGLLVCDYQDINGDGIISGGDTISVNQTSLTGIAPYTITLIYSDDAIGTAKFTPT
jgi:flagellin-like protein